MLRVAAAIEADGIPAVAVCSEAFGPMARAIAVASGVPRLPVVEYPGPGLILTDPDQEFTRKVTGEMLSDLARGLTRETRDEDARSSETGRREGESEEYEPRGVLFRGGIDEVNDYFYSRGWTDGLPVIPPTVERVEQFVALADRDPQEVLGVLRPENREATPWNCAVNAVMAGCRPEHMPILVAIVEAIADPVFHLQDAGSTPGWEPIVCVSGPIVSSLEFNADAGVMRAGCRPNTAIGRFLRLYMRNVAGLRIPPFATDQAGIGYTFNVVLPESAANVERSGWPSIRAELGVGADESIVVLQSVRSISPPIYSMGSSPDDHIDAISHVTRSTIESSVHRAYKSGRQFPLVVMTAGVARVLSSAGMSRRDFGQRIAERCLMPLDDIQLWAERTGSSGFLAERSMHSWGWELVTSCGRSLARMIVDPDMVLTIVAGNPGRNQTRVYCDNSPQGQRVVKKIRACT